MKLMVPAIKPPAPDANRQEASEATAHILAEIDALLAECFTAYQAEPLPPALALGGA
jgi:hypothetical protein